MVKFMARKQKRFETPQTKGLFGNT